MAINLVKGQKVKVELSRMTAGLGWDPNEQPGGPPFDLDASAFLLNDQGKLMKAEHFIFYNNLCGLGHNEENPCEDHGCADGDFGVRHTGDDPDGSSDGDDKEQILFNLDDLPEDVSQIVIVVTIDAWKERKQNFGQVKNSYMRLLNEAQEEVMKYELDEDFSIETAVEFGRIYKRNNQWKFEASGRGYAEDLSYFVSNYYDGNIVK